MRRPALFLLVLATLASCASGGAGGSDDDRLRIVTTVSPITNIAANVVGGLVDVEGLVPEGENSHEFEPAPRVAATLSRADLIFANGLELETPTLELANANLKDGAEIVELGSRTIDPDEYVYDFSFPKADGHPNPHLWTNPPFAKRFAEIIRDEISERDPDNADTYRENTAAFAERIDELDRALRAATDTVPREARKLLTYHDSFPYFAREYGWTVVGAIQPSDFSEPTPREVADLIEQISEEDVPAIFGSEVFPSPVLERIADESGADYVDDLRDDDLPGEAGDDEHTYLALMAFDYITIVDALGGDPSAIEEVETSNVTEDEARYA